MMLAEDKERHDTYHKSDLKELHMREIHQILLSKSVLHQTCRFIIQNSFLIFTKGVPGQCTKACI